MYSLSTSRLARPCRSALAFVSRSARTPLARVRAQSTTSISQNPSSHPPPIAQNEQPPALTEPFFASQIVHGRSLLKPYHHPPTHHIPVALLHFRSHHLNLLNLYMHFAQHAAAALAVPVTNPASLPTQRRLWTVIKGPFVHKKAQENFERKTHKRVVKVYDADQGVVDKLVAYLEHHELAGVGLRVVRWHRAPVGVGALTMEAMKGQLRRGGAEGRKGEAVTTGQKVKKLGERIVAEETKAAKAKEEAGDAAKKS
ncbi:hypothetical protein EUX98_g6923 [Antrodiella citrinella]|uniref:Small ribosomal subunit protein uS10 domain-containing protein n=1 Tax=Antrodiella citrinella TaxID=2447956 RepID=A0A4S4MV87_9APHY|nr:hypothetical protein EUX98_g6923 [Antrodiella citrinella]